MKLRSIEKKIQRMKVEARKQIARGNINDALQLIACVASVYYAYNDCYTDDDLEDMLVEIAKCIKADDAGNSDTHIVLFYDGFGLENRGLSYIYVKALQELGYHIIYVTNAQNERKLIKTREVVTQSDGCFYFIEDKMTSLKTTNRILEVIKEVKPGKAFFYAMPNDSFAAVAFMAMPECIHRYQINLTDHAFWLGIHVFDKCLEFRNYGASISAQYRGVEIDQLIIQPFYPSSDYKGDFQGFPFDRKEDDFVIFSGGALYKTIDKEGTYYGLVDHILEKYSNVRFWYAGSGESDEMDKLLRKYPERIFHTAERIDLVQILMHSDLYLSTYPLSGGLMTQYAASVGCFPLTIWGGQHNEGVLLDRSEYDLYVETAEELLAEFDRLYTDKEYRFKRGNDVKKCVLTETQFVQNLGIILEEGVSAFSVSLKTINTADFQNIYQDRVSEKEFLEVIGSIKYPVLARLMPFYYATALIKKFYRGGAEEEVDLTVCFATYNPNWEKMRASLVSLLRQKHIRFEIIITDDGSESKECLEKAVELFYQFRFDDYTILNNECNRGTVWNVFTAYQKARGFFIRGLSPGDLLPSVISLSELVDGALGEERYLAFGDSIYYCMVDKTVNILRLRNAPPVLFPYRKNDGYLMRLSYLLCGNLICAANMLLFNADLVVEYLGEIAGRVTYAEDNIYRMMMFDGILFFYISCVSCFYEYGYGVSTSHKKQWSTLLQKDLNAANDIMIEWESDDCIAKRFQISVRLQKENRQYVYRAYKYLHLPTLILKLLSTFFFCKTRECKKEEKGFLEECYYEAIFDPLNAEGKC